MKSEASRPRERRFGPQYVPSLRLISLPLLLDGLQWFSTRTPSHAWLRPDSSADGGTLLYVHTQSPDRSSRSRICASKVKLSYAGWLSIRNILAQVHSVLVPVFHNLPPVATFLVHTEIRLRICSTIIPIVCDEARIASTEEVLHKHVDAMFHMNPMERLAAGLFRNIVQYCVSESVQAICTTSLVLDITAGRLRKAYVRIWWKMSRAPTYISSPIPQ